MDDSVEQRCFIRCSQNFFPPAWTTAWNSCVSFVEVTHRLFSLQYLRRNTTGSSHNTHTHTYKRTHRTELVTVLVNCDTSSSHPSRSRMGISWIVLIYRLPGGNSFNNEATKKIEDVCVSGEGIYCNVARNNAR